MLMNAQHETDGGDLTRAIVDFARCRGDYPHIGVIFWPTMHC
jgi:hypothetical protein